MEPQRFDGLVRGLARASTRRDLVRAAAASFAGAVLAAIGIRSAGAQCVPEGGLCFLACCPGLRCRDGRCARCQPINAPCGSGRECCGNARCEWNPGLGGRFCRCRPGETNCNGTCRNLNADPFACGTCLNQCRLGTEACLAGRCCADVGQTCPGECSADQPCPGCCHGFCHRSGLGRRLFCGCPPDTRLCGDICLPAGQCCTDADCEEGRRCSPESRQCVGCPPGQRDCGGFCVPVNGCCSDLECTSASPHCVDGTCQECPVAGQHYECRTFPSVRLGCAPETFCGCIPEGRQICPLSGCSLDDTCLQVVGFGALVTCQALYFCV